VVGGVEGSQDLEIVVLGEGGWGYIEMRKEGL
jgi:hypothetical protein